MLSALPTSEIRVPRRSPASAKADDVLCRLEIASGLHKGDRAYQQDQLAVLQHVHYKGCVLAIVADGMGGRTGGREASEQVLMTAQQLFDRYVPNRNDGVKLLTQIVREAHMTIRLNALASKQQPHSTIAAVLVNPDSSCYCVHVGDTRIYSFRDGQLVFRTKDHSYVQLLIDEGKITPQAALTHPQGNILVGSLGAMDDPPLAVRKIEKIRPGDVMLLCSDGVWHFLSAAEMGTFTKTLSARQVVEKAIYLAKERAGGHSDNLSIIVMKVAQPPRSRKK